MTHLWDAEIAVSTRQAETLIQAQFPELIPADIRIIDYGFDNTVMKVNENWIFRFPRREIAVRLLETEGKLLPLLEDRGLDLQIPVPVHYGKPSSLYKWPFLGYRFVEGTLPSRADAVLREGGTAIRLARFLKKLHGTDPSEAEKRGVPYDEMDRLNVEKRKAVVEKNTHEIKKLGLFPQVADLERYLDHLPGKPLPQETILVHGDLHFKNIVVDEEGVLSGIIDWGDAHLGHRAIDLNLVYCFLTPKGREVFFREYGEVEEVELEYARFKAIYTNVVLLLYGYHEKQPHTLMEARKSLELALT
ncbi:phosphotransferase [Bacillus sp. AFS015802]|uniref:phosphotransferase n=1 Tax=Bacillus sp. AFS015802 TaxID=2033486 RepID=UPI000BF8AACD|nr:phosphotransferase [Bacillus sp. AFS015802]PFA68304.1 phosphotransferase [Bacillus sp. AFS015802]